MRRSAIQSKSSAVVVAHTVVPGRDGLYGSHCPLRVNGSIWENICPFEPFEHLSLPSGGHHRRRSVRRRRRDRPTKLLSSRATHRGDLVLVLPPNCGADRNSANPVFATWWFR